MKNKKTITIGIAMILTLFTLVLASAMYAGDCQDIDLSTMQSLENITWDVVGNSSNMTGLNITLNETSKMASICPVINYKPDTFTIIFTDSSNNTQVVEVTADSPVCSSCGGGGSSTTYKTEYIERNVTQYIDRDNTITSGDTIGLENDDTDEEPSCGLGQSIEIPKFVQYIIMGVIFIAGIIIFILYHKKMKEMEQQEAQEQETPEEQKEENIKEEYY